MRRSVLALGVGVPLVSTIAVVSLARRSMRADLHDDAASIAKLGPAAAAAAATAPPAPTLAGLDLAKMTVSDKGATAPIGEKRTARLTVDVGLQRTAEEIMTAHHLPEASIVLMDVATGKILVYASHIGDGEGRAQRDLCVEATAPAASVFKIITASALVEHAGLSPDERTCYSGGEQRITEKELQPNPRRDKWCATLAQAMGRSLNTVFARNALEHLKPPVLEGEAKALGFGAPLPFDVPVQPSTITVPTDDLGFARTAAGFWNTTLSPLHAAWLSATVARNGEPVRPVIVSDVLEDGHDKPFWTAPAGLAQKRAIKPETAQAVLTMMDSTVSDGTCYKAFHDKSGHAFLGGIPVAGKTGTLTDGQQQRFYTWFTGFAPSHKFEMPEDLKDENGDKIPAPRQVAIGVLVVNHPTWNIKANVLAREVLRAYFAGAHVPNVTAPKGLAPNAKDDGDRDQPSATPGTKHARHRGS
jgi:membrane peptidoglycan carboxypeptidase